MRAPRLTILMGDPGSGKSALVGRTAPRRPVHFIDIDTKIQSAGWAQPLIDKGDMTAWVLDEPIDPSPFRSRLDSLSKELKSSKPLSIPKGVDAMDEYLFSIKNHPDAMAAGSWVFDSLTILGEHVKTRMMYTAGRSKYTFDQWAGLKIWWLDFMSRMRDMMREFDKDIYLTIHERFKEEPGDRTTGVQMQAVQQGDEAVMQRVFLGTQELKVWASIDGQSGDLLGALADEYYHTYVDVSDKNAPKWKVRILPDGRRNLRTSMWTQVPVWDPDLSKIWGEEVKRNEAKAPDVTTPKTSA